MFSQKIKRGPFGLVGLKNFSVSSNCPPLRIDLYDSSKILSNYFKSGRVEDAEKLFEEIPQKNVVTYSIMIHGYAKNGFH